jgi:hypothetical protein
MCVRCGGGIRTKMGKCSACAATLCERCTPRDLCAECVHADVKVPKKDDTSKHENDDIEWKPVGFEDDEKTPVRRGWLGTYAQQIWMSAKAQQEHLKYWEQLVGLNLEPKATEESDDAYLERIRQRLKARTVK